MSVKPIFFALDGKELNEFREELEKLKGVIYGVKVGLEMFTAEGPSSVEKLKNDGWKVFLDLKLHDIPNTVQAAAVSAGNIGADYLTIHIASEKEALLAASENKTDNIKLLGVSSALTSKAMDEETSNKVEKDFIGLTQEEYDLLVHLIAKDWKKANLSERHQALCHFAEKVSEDPKQMKFEDLSSLKQTGYSDRAIHDAVQIIGYFNYINRIADSLGVEPETFTHQWELSTPN